MIRLAITIAVFASALLSAFAANAKASPQARICGTSPHLSISRACVITAKEEIVHALLNQSGAFVRRSPPAPAPFYRVSLLYPGHPWYSAYVYVPSQRMIRVTPPGSRPYWRSAPKAAAMALHRLSERIQPFPAPRHW
jgi:hypothetical protein